MRTRVPRALGLAVAAVTLPLAAHAAKWEAVTGDLGRHPGRLLLHIGANYGSMSGSELEKVDPGPGVEGGVAYRFYSTLSVTGSYAINGGNVDGQITSILDKPVQPGGRSAHAIADVEISRIRAGIRFDALHEEGNRFRPYFAAAVLFSKTTVDLKSVDGGFPQVDPKIEDDTIGGMARGGLEMSLTGDLSLEIVGTFEAVEVPATQSIWSAGGGLVYRI